MFSLITTEAEIKRFRNAWDEAVIKGHTHFILAQDDQCNFGFSVKKPEEVSLEELTETQEENLIWDEATLNAVYDLSQTCPFMVPA